MKKKQPVVIDGYAEDDITEPVEFYVQSPNQASQLKELAQLHTEAAINTLVRVINDDKAAPTAQVAAATALLDRGWGKPGVEGHINEHAPISEIKVLFGQVHEPAKIATKPVESEKTDAETE